MSRRRVWRLPAVYLVALVTLSGLVPAISLLSMSASASPTDPSCTYYYPSYTVRIFQNLAHIHDVLGARDLHDGQVVQFTVCSRADAIDLQAVMDSGSVNFYEWAAQTGTFANYQASETYFYPPLISGYQGYLLLVLDIPATHNWGGYVASGSTIYFASAQIALPAANRLTYERPFFYLQSQDEVGAWVGLGGYGTGAGANLWQAGAVVHVTDTGQVTMRAFYEYVPGSNPVEASWTLTAGDTIQVAICWASYH